MQQNVRASFGKDEELVVLIRPTTASSYMNLVDILDEMLILDVKKYALMDSPPENTSSRAGTKKPC
jgi:hypothetical protein